jgi:Uma2 family endonuclease
MKILKLPRATVEDLYELDEKGEIVNGEIVLTSPTGFLPHRAALNVTFHLRQLEATHGGYAIGDGAAFVVGLAHRKSFSPDAAWYTGEPTGGRFMQSAPAFAVEVRSEGDDGLQAEREMMAKRADYFAAGTSVVWDVDVLREQVVRVYHSAEPDTPVICHRWETAEAEPAVPGWRFPVGRLWD